MDHAVAILHQVLIATSAAQSKFSPTRTVALQLNPRLTVRRASRQYPIRKATDAARLAAFLRNAGLAES